MVDCGVTFRRDGEPGPHVQMADPAFISDRRDALSALLITHAHQDHVGAVQYLWPRLRCPVYATAFTLALLRPKLAEVGLLDHVPLHEVRPGDRLSIDGFDVEWVDITHSTPESQALVIRTAAGRIFHTGDWKLDAGPVVGANYRSADFTRLAQEAVDAMVCDSTNANVPGASISEATLQAGLLETIADAPGRVIVGCFGSNVARLATLARVAARTGRYAGVLGRSLELYYRAAQTAGVWPRELRLVDAQHLGYLPRREVLAIATGSQGEPRAALDRLAADSHRAFSVDPGDRLVMSARVIPGNERSVDALIDRLAQRGVQTINDGDGPRPIHASGHPPVEDLKALYGWVQPRTLIPVHGEPMHLDAQAAVARDAGIPRQMVGRNGDLFLLAPQRAIRRGAVTAGRLGVEREQLVTVQT
ncbi:MAG: ribonuclease J, partial [Pseudomonadota bacterium]